MLGAEEPSAGDDAKVAELQQQLAGNRVHAEKLQQQLVAEKAAADAKLREAQKTVEAASKQLHRLEEECCKLGQEVAELQVGIDTKAEQTFVDWTDNPHWQLSPCALQASTALTRQSTFLGAQQ